MLQEMEEGVPFFAGKGAVVALEALHKNRFNLLCTVVECSLRITVAWIAKETVTPVRALINQPITNTIRPTYQDSPRAF